MIGGEQANHLYACPRGLYLTSVGGGRYARGRYRSTYLVIASDGRPCMGELVDLIGTAAADCMQMLGSALELYHVEKQGVNETKRDKTRTWKVTSREH